MSYFNGYFGVSGGGTVVLDPVTAINGVLPLLRRGDSISFNIPNLPPMDGADDVLFAIKNAEHYKGREDRYSEAFLSLSAGLIYCGRTTPTAGQTGSLSLLNATTLTVTLSAAASAALALVDVVGEVQIDTGVIVQTIGSLSGSVTADVVRATS